jgi:gamma-glutamylcyclotransferase (GGCT)/AIG2-like uncharacterized protein YtfP
MATRSADNDRPVAPPDWPGDGCLLFAYGSLQRGGQYHYFLENCRAQAVGRGRLVAAYPLVLADYPRLLDRPGTGLPTRGEVYRIPRAADWAALDRLEGHPREYRRRPEAVEIAGQIALAWVYFYVLDDIPRSPSPSQSTL